MCIALLSIGGGDTPLIIGLNRDEFRDRPAAVAAPWGQDSPILAGKDLPGGGTWMGVTYQGRIGIITNFRDPKSRISPAESRGLIVKEYLESTLSPEAFIEGLKGKAHRYNQFNLLVGTTERLVYFTNRTQATLPLKEGVSGLSNGMLNEAWPKVTRGAEGLRALLKKGAAELPDELIRVLQDRRVAPDAELPSTGVPLAVERAISPLFIDAPEQNYGTRSSTVLTVDKDNLVTFVEVTYEPDGKASRVTYTFTLGRPETLTQTRENK